MRKTLSKSVLVMAAASGILTASGGYAFADASADGAAIGSPGVGSGNTVQVPVHIPVNLCGNTVNVIGALNPAFGNECENESGGAEAGDAQGADADGVAANSPGVLSGNLIQAPVDVPVNVCGNTVDVVGALNPAFGNECENESGGVDTPKPPHPHKPPKPHKPPTHHHDHGHDCACEPGHHHNPPKPPKPPKPHKPPTHHHDHNCPPSHHHNPPTHNPPTHNPPTHNPPTHTWHPHNPPTHTWHHTPPKHHKPPQMAHTGANDNLGIAGGASAALVLGGGLLMRRSRAAQK
ncbi:chaplin [Streptomyces sp. BE230]|uniref:chaplin n=1 Tax=Streptomyces sp. BE230 TaxID=3002526 RepID=UPI002ED2EA3A|nr:chaplin [Streptomyces sp. BE230]